MDHTIKEIREQIVYTIPAICPERIRYFTESMKQTEGEYIAVRRAKAFANVLKRMTKYIEEGECIVGNQASKRKAAPIFPEYATGWLIDEFNGDPYFFDQRPSDRFVYRAEDKEEILEHIDYWKQKSLYENIRKTIPQYCSNAWDVGAINDDWVCGAGIGNQIADYELVLKKGLRHNIQKAREKLQEADVTKPGNVRKIGFLESVIISNEAVIEYAHQYAALCERTAAAETNEKRRRELETMAQNCYRVPEFPAQTFWQALQSVWFILAVQHIETNGHAMSLGRFDQYMFPFYQQDAEAGEIDRRRVLLLTEMFFLKINELNKIRSWQDTAAYLGYPMNCNLAIGGRLWDGSDAANEMTYICLDACEDIRMIAPSLSAKISPVSGPDFMDRCLSVVRAHKGGMPAFYNDEAFETILRSLGAREEDAFNWAPVGCIESCIPGKWDFAAKGACLNAAKVFEMTINNGTDPLTDIQLCPGDGYLDDFDSADDLFQAYKKQLDYFMEALVRIEHINDAMHEAEDINAFRSSLIEDCIGRGKSLFEGGAVYSADGGPVTGTNTVADSFSAIQYAVFAHGLINMHQLRHALETNFMDETTTPTGAEIRNILTEKCPKFGNDNAEADRWSVEIVDYIGEQYHSRFRNSRYGKGPVPGTFELSVSSVTANVPSGRIVGALPNGRYAGKPLNNGISPSNGAEKTSLTAAIKSVGKMPSRWFQKGAIFNVKLAEKNFIDTETRRNTAALLRTFFKMGGVHLQFNVLDDSTLLDARKNPDEYADLMVRIAGYSALFVSLSKELQDDLIERVQF